MSTAPTSPELQTRPECSLAPATGSAPVVCDGREFATTLDAALHLLWLLQRLSYYEPHREGQPCDGFTVSPNT